MRVGSDFLYVIPGGLGLVEKNDQGSRIQKTGVEWYS
jgi:hypothetical protein